MEAQTQLQDYLEQGKQALAHGQGREAAIAYAHGAQLETENPQVHLGLAEANLALGNLGVVQMACRRVQELQPDGGLEGWTAQALLDLLERRYERALQSTDKAIDLEPSIGYLHALRSYLLRATGQDYDANLARARATRLSYGGRFENCFPPLEPHSPATHSIASTLPPQPQQPGNTSSKAQAERESVPSWSQPNPMRRQMVRTRFALGQYPTLVTNILIAINVIVYILEQLSPQVVNYGTQVNQLVAQGEYWRILTAMFMHASIFHILINMFSLYMVGRAVEVFYGKWRYLVIYLLSGIVGGLAFFLLSGLDGSAVGASGAIFGIFGAVGVFYIINRRALGAYGTGAIGQWIFLIILNLAIGIMPGTGIAIWDHIGGLIAGIILAYLLIPRNRRGRMLV